MHVDDAFMPPRPGRPRYAAVLLAALAALAAGLWPGQARASWFLNQAQFHASAHASLACADCHGDIAPGKAHPNPADVTKPLAAFFKPDQCLGCHADVAGDLAKGIHAGQPVAANQDSALCIRCHDPHTQTAKNHPAAFDPAKPVEAQCGACHEKRQNLPAPDKDAAACLACHQDLPAADPGRRNAVNRLCLDCHGAATLTGPAALLGMPTMDKAAQAGATHQTLSCLACHVDGARFPHDRQQRVACVRCHSRHDEAVTHDAHTNVTCEACHLSGVTPVKDAASGLLVARLDKAGPGALQVHAMTLPAGEASCRRCHVPGNTLGAAAMVLPAKGLLCMPCHAATFSVSDTTSSLSLLVFLGGMAVLAVSWFSTAGLGAVLSGPTRATGQARTPIDWAHLWNTAFYDVFLQRRLYRQSPRRWAVHALIFFPFVFRFLWGLAGLLTSLWLPRTALPWALLDKNNPLGAFLFDASGLALLLGLLLAAVSWARREEEAAAPGLPGRDWPALLLLMALVVVGFVLEGLRIAMTGWPAGSAYAFAGFALADLLRSAPATSLSAAYGFVWYAHAILTGLVVAYLPVSQLRHVVTAPLAMLLGAMHKDH